MSTQPEQKLEPQTLSFQIKKQRKSKPGALVASGSVKNDVGLRRSVRVLSMTGNLVQVMSLKDSLEAGKRY